MEEIEKLRRELYDLKQKEKKESLPPLPTIPETVPEPEKKKDKKGKSCFKYDSGRRRRNSRNQTRLLLCS